MTKTREGQRGGAQGASEHQVAGNVICVTRQRQNGEKNNYRTRARRFLILIFFISDGHVKFGTYLFIILIKK